MEKLKYESSLYGAVNFRSPSLQFAVTSQDPKMRDSHIVEETIKDQKIVVQTYDVDIIRIAEYIKSVVGTRIMPREKKGTVVMKLDVEVNAEYNESEFIFSFAH